jgi:HD-like signal output (HDOD) protein
MAELAKSIADDIQTALDKDQLELPSLPEVALRIREEAESEFVSAVSLAKVVGDDAGLAAQLVRIANSPMFRATRSIDDLSQAISRLGVDYSANLVTGLAMQNMFQATTEFVDNRLRQVWRDSTEVAAWSSILCKRYTRLRPDQATLAGLTHCIGILPILSWVEENDNVVRDSMTLDRVIDSIHPTIGTMILRHWNFAEDIIVVPEQYQLEDHNTDSVDYVDIVCAASWLVHKDPDQSIAEHSWARSACLSRIGFDPEMDELELESLSADVSEVKSAFH